jgi:hypothetical protein
MKPTRPKILIVLRINSTENCQSLLVDTNLSTNTDPHHSLELQIFVLRRGSLRIRRPRPISMELAFRVLTWNFKQERTKTDDSLNYIEIREHEFGKCLLKMKMVSHTPILMSALQN